MRPAALAAAIAALTCAHAAAAAEETTLNNRGVEAAQAGRFSEAAALLRQALALDPADATATRNLSGVLTDWARQLDREGRVPEAITALEEAASVDGANGPAWALLGDLRYLRRNDFAGAIQAWERAAAHAPADVAQSLASRITRAQRDQVIERGFVDGPLAASTAHFTIRFQQATAADLTPLQEALEAQHERLTRALGEGPPHVSVIVYSATDLDRVATKRDWAIGLYDGRLRLRADDLQQPYLADLVAHELAHAFLHFRYGPHLPLWVHEGVAQLQEAPRSPSPELEALERGIRSRTSWIPLKWLDRRFTQPAGTDDVFRAYAQSRFVVEELITRHGMPRVTSFLEALGKGQPIETAYDAAFAPSRWARADRGVFD